MSNNNQQDASRQQRLDTFKNKLQSLSDMELVALCEIARRGTIDLEAEWDLIIKELGARKAQQIKSKHSD